MSLFFLSPPTRWQMRRSGRRENELKKRKIDAGGGCIGIDRWLWKEVNSYNVGIFVVISRFEDRGGLCIWSDFVFPVCFCRSKSWLLSLVLLTWGELCCPPPHQILALPLISLLYFFLSLVILPTPLSYMSRTVTHSQSFFWLFLISDYHLWWYPFSVSSPSWCWPCLQRPLFSTQKLFLTSLFLDIKETKSNMYPVKWITGCKRVFDSRLHKLHSECSLACRMHAVNKSHTGVQTKLFSWTCFSVYFSALAE